MQRKKKHEIRNPRIGGELTRMATVQVFGKKVKGFEITDDTSK